jgi:hypothetical protein
MGILDDAIREHLELKRRHGVPEDEVERQEEEALGPARRDVAQQPEDAENAADAVDDASLFDGEHRDAPVAEAPAVADDETVLAEAPAAEEPPAVEAPAPSAQPLAEAEPSAVEAPPEEPLPEEPLPDEPFPEEPLPDEALPDEPLSEEPPEPDPPVADHTGMEPPPAEPEPPEPDPHAALGDTEPHGFPALDDDELPEDDAVEGDARDDAHDAPVPASDDEDELDVLEDTPDFLQETPEHDRLWFEQKPPRDFDFD